MQTQRLQTITIPKREYEELIDVKLRFKYLSQIFKEDIFLPPPTKNVKNVMGEFKKTNLYNQKFLASLENGLKKSTYFKNGNTTN